MWFSLTSMSIFSIESLFIYYLFAVQQSMWDLTSPIRDQTHTSCSEGTESDPLDRQGIPESRWF